jgi:hypothetical protein
MKGRRLMTKNNITLEITVEELAERYPEAVGFLARHNIRCIRCGEPLWCTLRELFREDGVENPQLLIEELKKYLEKSGPKSFR